MTLHKFGQLKPPNGDADRSRPGPLRVHTPRRTQLVSQPIPPTLRVRSPDGQMLFQEISAAVDQAPPHLLILTTEQSRASPQGGGTRQGNILRVGEQGRGTFSGWGNKAGDIFRVGEKGRETFSGWRNKAGECSQGGGQEKKQDSGGPRVDSLRRIRGLEATGRVLGRVQGPWGCGEGSGTLMVCEGFGDPGAAGRVRGT